MENRGSRRQVGRRAACAAAAALILWGICPADIGGADISGENNQVFSLEAVTVEAKRPDWEEKLSPGTVTVIRPDDYKGEQKTLADLLKEVPGVHVREVNGKGQYTTVSVRGSTAAQVGVFIDGVLTNLGGDAAVDISTIPVKNVERIEVYRGYIPSRFGGIFIGGVINVVTKKPGKAQTSAEIGKSSYGGKSLSADLTAPLGSGSLMAAGSYESSDGDFRYGNYAARRYIPQMEQSLRGARAEIDDFNNNWIDILTRSNTGNVPMLDLTADQIAYYKAHNDAWLDYIRGSGDNSLTSGIAATAYKRALTLKAGDFKQQLIDMGVRDAYLKLGYTDSYRNNWLMAADEDWNGTMWDEGIITKTMKEKILQEYVAEHTGSEAAEYQNKADPETSMDMAAYKKQEQFYLKKLKEAQDKARWRKYNSYENGTAFVKWQNANWMVKGAWNHMDRYLPDGLWGGDPNSAVEHNNVDLYDVYYFDKRRQKLDNTELLLQNRQQHGRLEWGWMAGYFHQKKSYRSEHIMDNGQADHEAITVPLRAWSRYRSNKYNIQMDGTYRLTPNQMLDFQTNYSHERLHIYGSLMDKVLGDSDLASTLGQTRNRYDQDIFNIQMQDTVTLDSWQVTPAVRYNRSAITGYSDGARFQVNQTNRYHWIHPRDKQTDGKATWQIAIKKQINDAMILRMTGGTYYRLLNMYEIAGDGAGILPAPRRDGRSSVFPMPEYGKQFDFGMDWTGKVLRAEQKTTVTYFWRESDRMLQLVRYGKDYWSYLNDNRGRVRGVELQSSFRWNKFDLDLRGTYTKSHMERKNSAVHYNYSEVWPTYQPKWEGNVRLTYHPVREWAVFGEVHYTDQYFTMYSRDSRGGEYAYLSGKPVSSLTVTNGGVKWNPTPAWQIAVGCNDIFNRGPKQKIRSNTAFTIPGYINPEFPLQGRTYYATVRYEF